MRKARKLELIGYKNEVILLNKTLNNLLRKPKVKDYVIY